ncbi:MAG: hypothetical protein LH603_12785 [Pseudonocardia sp.]|nr:hypothetical protein [Pseudonocardia sp.]
MSPPRERRSSRHRAAAPAAPVGDDSLAADGELDSYLAALAADGPTSGVGRFGSAQVFQLRLSAERTEQLRKIAQDRGVSPGALALDWVIERLDREDTSTAPLAVVEEAERRRLSPLARLRRRGS